MKGTKAVLISSGFLIKFLWNKPFIQSILSFIPVLSAKIRLFGCYFFEDDVLTELDLQPGWIFIDVGAYVGSYTVWASKQVGNKGLVLAFEPCPQNFKQLSYNVKGLTNVRTFPVAIWNENDTLVLHLGGSASPATNSLVRTDGKSGIQVKALQLDSLFNLIGLNHVDAIKIDAESAEIQVLEGMKDILKLIKVICIEVHNPNFTPRIKDLLRDFQLDQIGIHIIGRRKEHLNETKLDKPCW